MEARRYGPNIIVTGTPGCGKSSTCELLKYKLKDYKYYNISDFAKDNDCFEGYDEGRKSHIVDEDKLLDMLEPLLRQGNSIVDWHVNDVFPERLIDLVVVLRCDNSNLYSRLHARGYHDSKIEENLDAEIMGIVKQDAVESYEPHIVVELQSDTKEDMVSNVSRIVAWEKMWLEQHPDGVTNEYQGPRSDDEDDEDSE
ncbi:FAP7 [Saccharomyces cerevisiae]|nr:FAP7 [Saccharomyces cerevisiae]